MRLLVLSDVHANLEALEACLEAAPKYDAIANLGDVVGYNASPNEVCTRIREMDCPVVRGNHDRACSGLSDLSEFNLVAAMSARWTQTALDPDHREWLRNLPEGPLRSDTMPGIELVHGSPRDEDEYVLNAPTAALDFHLPGHADVIFFGHTHVQGGFAFSVADGKTRPLLAQVSQRGFRGAVEDRAGSGRALSHQSGFGRSASRQRSSRRLRLIRSGRLDAGHSDLLPRSLRHSPGTGTNHRSESS